MNTKVNTADVMKWLKNQSGSMTAIGIVFTAIWLAYGEPKVKEVVQDTMKPLEIKVDTLEQHIKKIAVEAKHRKFESRQQMFLLSELAGDKAVKKMKEQTQVFRPMGYED